MYKLFLKPFFFLFNPETAHGMAMGLFKTVLKIPGFRSIFRGIYDIRHPVLKRNILGLEFKNPVGLAAGFDKNAEWVGELGTLGFGFVEIGTLTPRPQPGKPRPRLFRLVKDKALINRMGFNNDGVLKAADRLRWRRKDVIVGGNIGKNLDTPIEDSVHDYEYCFEALYEYVDYFVVNVSSPNTPNLRELQEKEPLRKLLSRIQERNRQKKAGRPILLKIAPDLSTGQLDDIIEIIAELGIDGIIATNTTISRDGLMTPEKTVEGIGDGGLSGSPLAERSTEVIRYIREKLGPDVAIIGVGGISGPDSAFEKIDAGADLIQLYTGFIFEGPGIAKKINKALIKRDL